MWHYFKGHVKWATAQQWLQMANYWETFPGAVAVIDGTRRKIQRPQTEPQEQFYSGHCCYHNFSTQIISIGNYTVREILMKNRTRVWRNVYNI